MLHGSQRTEVNLSFSIPSVCAERLAEGVIDVGLAPVAEIARQELQIVHASELRAAVPSAAFSFSRACPGAKCGPLRLISAHELQLNWRASFSANASEWNPR
jgi:hypothetical protein